MTEKDSDSYEAPRLSVKYLPRSSGLHSKTVWCDGEGGDDRRLRLDPQQSKRIDAGHRNAQTRRIRCGGF